MYQSVMYSSVMYSTLSRLQNPTDDGVQVTLPESAQNKLQAYQKQVSATTLDTAQENGIGVCTVQAAQGRLSTSTVQVVSNTVELTVRTTRATTWPPAVCIPPRSALVIRGKWHFPKLKRQSTHAPLDLHSSRERKALWYPYPYRTERTVSVQSS